MKHVWLNADGKIPVLHNYVKVIMGMVERGEIKLTPTTLQDIDVYHDDYCGSFKGGYCNYNPTVTVRR